MKKQGLIGLLVVAMLLGSMVALSSDALATGPNKECDYNIDYDDPIVFAFQTLTNDSYPANGGTNALAATAQGALFAYGRCQKDLALKKLEHYLKALAREYEHGKILPSVAWYLGDSAVTVYKEITGVEIVNPIPPPPPAPL